MRNFGKIEAWLLASDYALAIYGVTGAYPKQEQYGLVSQTRRAAISALANIAEGAARQHKKEYLHFLYIARGSLVESEALLEIALKLSYLQQTEHQKLLNNYQNAAKCLFGLIRAVEKKVPGLRSLVFCPNHNKGETYV